MFNGYIHPGPYSDKKAEFPILAPRQEPDPASLRLRGLPDIYGPELLQSARDAHCRFLTPCRLAAEEAAERKEAQERRAYREQLITEQAAKAAKAGHCPKRIEKAAAIARDPNELVLAMAKYFAGPTACQMPRRHPRRKAPKLASTRLAAHHQRRMSSAGSKPRPRRRSRSQPRSQPSQSRRLLTARTSG